MLEPQEIVFISVEGSDLEAFTYAVTLHRLSEIGYGDGFVLNDWRRSPSDNYVRKKLAHFFRCALEIQFLIKAKKSSVIKICINRCGCNLILAIQYFIHSLNAQVTVKD